MNNSIYIFPIVFSVVVGKFCGPTNQAGLEIIKEYEGFHPYFYNDSIGHYFIGYGHFCQYALACTTPIFGKYEVPLNYVSADALLREDLSRRGGAESCVNNAISYQRLNENQFSALVSFVQNMGCNYFWNSYLRNKINRGHIKAAVAEFGKHVYAGGRRYQKLEWRRAAEKDLFCKNVSPKWHRAETTPGAKKFQLCCAGEPVHFGMNPKCYIYYTALDCRE